MKMNSDFNGKISSPKSTLLFTLALLNVQIYLDSAFDHCCKFESDSLCGWTVVFPGPQWTWSGALVPNTLNQTDFDPVGGYMWLQTNGIADPVSGTIVSNALTINDGDVIGFDGYVYSSNASQSATSFKWVFKDNLGRQVTLVSIGSSSHWAHVTVTCGTQWAPCCVSYPCIGWINVVGTLATTKDLLAFDNVTVNECPVVTSTVATTSA